MSFSFEQAPIGLAHIAFDGQILLANSALGEVLGESVQSLMQLNYFSGLVHSADLALAHQSIQRLLNESVSAVDLQHRCRAGCDRRVHLTLSLWRDGDYIPQYLIAVLRPNTLKHSDNPERPDSPAKTLGEFSASQGNKPQGDAQSHAFRPVGNNTSILNAPPPRDQNLSSSDSPDGIIKPFEPQPRLNPERLKQPEESSELTVEEVLRQKNAEMAAIFEAFPDVFIRVTGEGGLLDYRVQDSSDLYLAPHQWQGHSIRTFLPERVALLFEEAIAQVIQKQNPVSLEYSLVQNQQNVYYETRLVPVQPNQVIGIIRNISDRKQIEAQLLHDALHDALTGLPNRTLFMDRVDMAMHRSKRLANHLFAVLFIDLDGFKLINDGLGHGIGDQLLMAIADLLRQCIRGGDTVARLGGDEFTILLDGLRSLDEVQMVADRVQSLLKTPISIDGNSIFTGASIGIVLGSPLYTKAVDLLRDADIALYQAKENGKGRYAIFDQQMYAETYSRQQLETHLRQALSGQQFCVHYQPIVEMDTRKLIGFESLVRWMHPQRGLIRADEFVPVAEDTGIIIPMGLWVLREACLQLRTWQDEFPEAHALKITVNLSSKQLREPALVGHVRQILLETGISGNQLKLELTESTLIENAEIARTIWEQLRALQIQFSLDDFGTGYCSLSYIHQYPVSTLKIDRSFVHQMTSSTSNTEIIRAIINLSKSLDMTVVAEGVETEEQLQQLRAFGCDFGQGYLFARPLAPQDASKLLQKDKLLII